MNARTAVASGTLGAVVAALPLALAPPLSLRTGLLPLITVVLAVGYASASNSFRALAAVLLTVWVAFCVVAGSGPTASVALADGVLLRLWCGLPDLARLGRARTRELVAEVIGGAIAAAVVITSAQAAPTQPAVRVVAALAGCLLLTGWGARRLKASKAQRDVT